MKKTTSFTLLAILLAVSLLLGGAAEPEKAKVSFSKTTMDIGMVVSDTEKAVAFYRDAVGFTEIPGFEVSEEVAGGSGLADDHPFSVKIMVLGKDSTATNLKLMSFPTAPGKKVDNTFIHTTLGVSYLTVHVADMNAAVDRAKEANAVFVKPSYDLGNNVYLTLLRDPDGNIIELVGPKK